MAGAQITGGKLVSDKGTNKGVTAQINVANGLVTIFTATRKTKVNSALVSNILGTVLPVELYVYRASDTTNYLVTKTRVLKSRYMILPLVPGDTRVSSTSVSESINDRMIATEIVLQVGDAIKAKCPLEDVINVTLDLREGIK